MTQSIITAGDASAGFVQTGGNDGTLVLQTGAAGSKVNAISIDAAGKVSITGQTVSASTTNTVTNKVAIVINGTTYYLLASTSGT
ncbi:MAG: hypothetical protein KGI54_11535 [Pseudomonadota bacterium]|nr:hypothetical protein [Pseudomonadota bacterium]